MHKKDSWSSEFRKKRFYENKERKAIKEYYRNQEEDKKEVNRKPKNIRSIAIMLDLDGTSDKMDASTAEIFMRQIDLLREQFGNGKAYICISTHSHGCETIKKVLSKLAPYATDDIVLGNSYFSGGIYDYSDDQVYEMGFMFNLNKVNTFVTNYVKTAELNVGWFAIIDDGVSPDVYKTFRESTPMVTLRPGCMQISKYTNFMHRETCTENIDGVIELLDGYIKDIIGKDYYDVLDEQEFMKVHLSSTDIHNMIVNRRFVELADYLDSDKIDKDDYIMTLSWLTMENETRPFEDQYVTYVNKIREILKKRGALNDSGIDEKKLKLPSDL